MKTFFIYFGALGLVALIGLGVYLSIGIPANSREIVKEIKIKQNA